MARETSTRKRHKDDSRVNHPSYYQATDRDGNPIEVVTVIEAFAADDGHMAHALTYLLRAGRKTIINDDEIEAYVEDLKKARWWITRAIEFYDASERED